MKTRLLSLLCLSLASGFIVGCTTTETTTAQTTKRQDVEITSEKRSYSQAELQKRGQPELGGALSAQDASIRVSGRR
ncbi:MAG: hypothetical protein ABI883_05760 [Chthoniobacterales bacterium]